MKFKNPIISGCYPDPSICRVGDDYYLVNSSFEYFPGIPVFHSKDLVHWNQIGHCITRNSQLTLRKGFPNCAGIFAPTIRYSNGIFYVITTNVAIGGEDDGNFFVWTKDPAGEWSDPVWLTFPGIDPSLFFDEDGKVYYTGTKEKIYVCEIDIQTGESKGEATAIWGGSGGNDPEGPHMYHRDGWYYLFISEGGTEYCHMITVARSRDIYGPYEDCHRNPVLSNRSHCFPIKAVGHSDLVEDQNGNWWAVCLGIRTISYPFRHNLGRETMLVPMYWDEEGWPVMGRDGLLDEVIETNLLPFVKDEVKSEEKTEKNIEETPYHFYDDFSAEKLDFAWNFIYNPISEYFSYEKGKKGITLFGNEVSISEKESLAWIGHRQKHHDCKIQTKLCVTELSEGEEAGLTIYMNPTHHYEIVRTKISGEDCIIFRRQIGSLWKIEQVVACEAKEMVFELLSQNNEYTFGYRLDTEEFITIGKGETDYLTTEVGGRFTGNYVALFASGNGKKCTNPVTFEWFEYESLEKE